MHLTVRAKLGSACGAGAAAAGTAPLVLGRGARHKLAIAQHEAAGAAAEEAVARDARRGHPQEADPRIQVLELVAGAHGVGLSLVGLQRHSTRC